MQFLTFALGALAATGVIAEDIVRACGTHDPTEAHIEMSKQFATEEAALALTGNESFRVAATTTVKVYVHVVASSQSASGGYLSVSPCPVFVAFALEPAAKWSCSRPM